jgi:hypothetical protein
MNPSDHSHRMLRWWLRHGGIHRADLAVRRADGSTVWHRSRALDSLPLPWARAENVRGAEVYVRPARGLDWPLLFLDDVDRSLALSIARKYRALVVHTSSAGGCHVWLSTSRPLSEAERGQAQRWLAARSVADPASTSGEHLGRLSGFKNWKRQGTWVSVLEASIQLPSWDPLPAFAGPPRASHSPSVSDPPHALAPLGSSRLRDRSASGSEWARVCAMLEAGQDSSDVHAWLLERARIRRGPDAPRYAQRTIERALAYLARRR